jgi:hypothetical protein
MKCGSASAACIIFSAVSTAAFAQTDRLPTPLDLKAAFCFGFMGEVVEKDSDTSNIPPPYKAVFDDAVVQNASVRERLRRFLLPRLSYLDSTSILVAVAEGKAAYGASIAAIGKCDPGAGQQAYRACFDRSTERTAGCYKSAFLPY